MAQEKLEKRGVHPFLDTEAGIFCMPGVKKNDLPPDLAPNQRPVSLVMSAYFLANVLLEDFQLDSTALTADAHGPFFYIQFDKSVPEDDFHFDAFFDTVEKAVNTINPGSVDLCMIQCDRETRSIFAPTMNCFSEFLRPFSAMNGLGLENDASLADQFQHAAAFDPPHTIYTIAQIEGAVRSENMRAGLTLNPDRLPVFRFH